MFFFFGGGGWSGGGGDVKRVILVFFPVFSWLSFQINVKNVRRVLIVESFVL